MMSVLGLPNAVLPLFPGWQPASCGGWRERALGSQRAAWCQWMTCRTTWSTLGKRSRRSFGWTWTRSCSTGPRRASSSACSISRTSSAWYGLASPRLPCSVPSVCPLPLSLLPLWEHRVAQMEGGPSCPEQWLLSET